MLETNRGEDKDDCPLSFACELIVNSGYSQINRIHIDKKTSIIFKPRAAQVKHIPDDEDEVACLMAKRVSGLPDVYRAPSDVIEISKYLAGYDRLIMKAPNVEENLARSKNEDG